MNVKNEKGVTLMILSITIIILLIITGITFSGSIDKLEMKNVSILYNDIEAINTKVSDYYLNNNSLPVYETPYINNSEEFKQLLVSNGGSEDMVNPNDGDNYYVINLSKLENLTLNYGRDYLNWNGSSSYQDLYIINDVTHQIYYPMGIKYNGNVYFSTQIATETINKITVPSIESGFSLESINTNKIVITDDNLVYLNSNIKLQLSSDFKADTLRFAWNEENSSNDLNFSKFSIDDTNSANIMSGSVNDVSTYYLFIRVLDVNGEEHEIMRTVEINE